MAGRTDRADATGLAYAGSQRQVQLYVNRRGEALSARVLELSLGGQAISLRWVSPLAKDRFVEHQDRAFLRALGMEEYADELKRFWPRWGPVWDALGVLENLPDGGTGIVLVEAKSHQPELYSGGCAASPRSLAQIQTALGQTKRWLGVPEDAVWTGPLYQYANRLAHLLFFREVAHLPAWLVNIYFVGDPRTPTTEAQWHTAIAQARQELGLAETEVPGVVSLLLEAADAYP